jgi:hypothetical protein
MVAVSSSETHTSFYKIAQHSNSQDIHVLFGTLRIRKFTTFDAVYHSVLRKGVIKIRTQGPHFHFFEPKQVPAVHLLHWICYNPWNCGHGFLLSHMNVCVSAHEFDCLEQSHKLKVSKRLQNKKESWLDWCEECWQWQHEVCPGYAHKLTEFWTPCAGESKYKIQQQYGHFECCFTWHWFLAFPGYIILS